MDTVNRLCCWTRGFEHKVLKDGAAMRRRDRERNRFEEEDKSGPLDKQLKSHRHLDYRSQAWH